MTQSKLNRLPTSDELPCSDDTPVDNELQNYLPNLLLFILDFIWSSRFDWFFGVDMGIYHTTGVSHLVPVIPDGFLSLGVERSKNGRTRKSYVLWEENNIPPIFVLEIASLTPGGEYDKKREIYAKLGVLYYLVYNPLYWQRDRHQPFELYRLVEGEYILQIGEPFFMPEIGLGIGRARIVTGGIEQDILCWYDANGVRYQTPEEISQARQQQIIKQQTEIATQQELLTQQQELLNRYRQQFGDLTD